MRDSSWVIVRNSDGQAMAEIFSPALAAQVNRAKYSAVPVYQYLTALN